MSDEQPNSADAEGQNGDHEHYLAAVPGYAGFHFFGVSNQELRSLVRQGIVHEKEHPKPKKGRGRKPKLYCIAEFEEYRRLKALALAYPRRHYVNLVPGFAGPRYFLDTYGAVNPVLRSLVRQGVLKETNNPICPWGKLYCIDNFTNWDAGRVNDFSAGDTYTDPTGGRTFLWMNLLREEPYKSKYHTTTESVYRWAEYAPGGLGCAVLDGEHPEVIPLRKRGKTRGGRTQRDYVDLDFLNRMVEAEESKSESTPARSEKNWVDLARVEDLGMDKKTAIAHSDSGDPRRKIPGKKHLAFCDARNPDGRALKTKRVIGVSGRQWIHGVRWWEPDIVTAVKADGPSKEIWADRTRMIVEYLIPGEEIDRHEKYATPELDSKKLLCKKFPHKPEFRKRTFRKYYWVQQAIKLSAFTTATAAPIAQPDRLNADREGWLNPAAFSSLLGLHDGKLDSKQLSELLKRLRMLGRAEHNWVKNGNHFLYEPGFAKVIFEIVKRRGGARRAAVEGLANDPLPAEIARIAEKIRGERRH